jgi:diguanylate cyclase (GGDEF)-like protein
MAFVYTLASASERGFPLITVHRAEEHRGGAQTFDVAQDARGILFFATLGGVLTYDGAWWRLIPLPDDAAVFAIESDAAGHIVLGGVGDIGTLDTDGRGTLQYRSFLPLLPAGQRDIGDLRSISVADRGFLFLTDNYLIHADGVAARVVADFRQGEAPDAMHRAGGSVYLTGEHGLQRLDGNRLVSAGFSGKHTDLVLGAGLAAVRDEGLFTMDGARMASAASDWIKGKRVTGGTKLPDGRLVITTREHGLAILSNDGRNIEAIIDSQAGLPEDILAMPFADREGALWLAFHGPIARLDLASPVSIIDARSGIKGSVNDVTRYGGKLLASTSHGVFALGGERIEGSPAGAWTMLPFNDELLVGSGSGIYRIDGNKATRIPGTERAGVYTLLRSTSDPSRVWAGTRTGLGVLHRTAAGWRYDGILPGSSPYLGSLVERDGVLWCGSVVEGVLRVDELSKPKPRMRRLGDGEMNVFEIGGRIVFTHAQGRILRLDSNGRFVPDPLLGHVQAPQGFFLLSEDRNGNVWLNSTPPRVVERRPDGTFEREARPLVSVTAADLQFLRADADGIVWFGSDRGLFRYEPSMTNGIAAQPPPMIRRVAAADDRVLFGGATGATSQAAELPPDFGRLRVEFAPVSFRPGVMYQYRLEPLDAGWSRWTAEPSIDYTNLAAGTYTFHVRARGAAAGVSQESTWSFTVLPPWYAKPFAIALWVLVAIGVVALVVRLRTRALSRQAEKLRVSVVERTDELHRTVSLLEQANERLERLSLLDDLTGIANRRYFQRALADEWERAFRRDQPLALILLDLDHFKELNDRRGHPAGDACLRAVGSFLAERVHARGDVVARYGGEEFAILVANSRPEEAMRVAESLREGIEQLSIRYDDIAALRVTGSCGVASMTPVEGETPEILIDRADRALYAAKHAGRNCVRYAADRSAGTWLRDVAK